MYKISSNFLGCSGKVSVGTLKRIFSILLTILLIVNIPMKTAMASQFRNYAVKDGNATWTLDDDSVTVTGTGILAKPTEKVILNTFSRYCTDSIMLQSGFTGIGNRAFSPFINVQHISLPEGIASIDDYAFYNCNKLIDVNIPNTVSTIGKECFSNCSALEGVELPESLTKITEYGTFFKCPSLRYIVVPDSFTEACAPSFSYIIDSSSNACIVCSPNHWMRKDSFYGQYCVNQDDNTYKIAAGNDTYYTYEPITGKLVISGSGNVSNGFKFRFAAVVKEIEFRNYTNNELRLSSDSFPKVKKMIVSDSITSISQDEVSKCSNLDIMAGSSDSEAETYALGHGLTFEAEDCNHQFSDWIIDSNPTCTEAGSKHKTCSICGKVVTEEIEALGHDWTEWVVTKEAGEYVNGVERRTCKRNATHIENRQIPALGHIHKLRKTEAIAPTCISPGNIEYYTCTDSSCGKYFSDEEGKNEINKNSITLPAKGHTQGNKVRENETPATCTENGGYFESVYCADCNARISYEAKTITKLGHKWSDWSTTKQPTCTSEGEQKRVCQNDSSHVETQTVSATGHAWGEWTEVFPATEEGEGLERRVCTNDPTHIEERPISRLDHVHKAELIEGEEATCTSEGTIDYYYCAKCGSYFTDKECRNRIQEAEIVIPKKAHTKEGYRVENIVEPSCTENGHYDKVYYCKVCEAQLPEFTETISTSAAGHKNGTPVQENYVAATCETDGGYDSVVYCTKCEKRISTTHVTLAKSGHKWGEWQYVQPSCETAGSKYRVCLNDSSHTEEESIDPIGSHDWGEWVTITEATEASDGLEKRICKRDNRHFETRVIPKKNHVHSLNRIVAKDSTCSSEGNIEYYKCIGCGRYFADAAAKTEIDQAKTVVQKKPHTEKVTKESVVDPTCENGGSYVEVISCSVCKAEISRKTVPTNAAGHIPGDIQIENYVDAELNKNGSYDEVRYCTKCKKELSRETKEIPAKNHKHYIRYVSEKTATCEKDGNIEYYKCSSCGELFRDSEGNEPINANDVVIKATGHKWGEWVVTTKATTTQNGEETRVCQNDETHIERRPIAKLENNNSNSGKENGENKTNPSATVTTPDPTEKIPTVISPVKKDNTKKINGVGTLMNNGIVLKDTYGKKYTILKYVKPKQLKKNLTVADSKQGKYKITSVKKTKGKVVSGTVEYSGVYSSKCTSATVPKQIKIAGVKFKVTRIGANAFRNCKKLGTVTIKSTSITKIGANAFKSVKSNIKIKVPKIRLEKYTKMIKKAKAPKKASIIKK